MGRGKTASKMPDSMFVAIVGVLMKDAPTPTKQNSESQQ